MGKGKGEREKKANKEVDNLKRVRVRQHVNPLSSKYQQLPSIPNWEQVYSNLHQPLHLDIGCARGRFLLQMAQLFPAKNFLGLEIRKPLVIDANFKRDGLGLVNLHYIFANINNSLELLLTSLPCKISVVTIQFPDPWFKNKHQKRRMVQPETVAILSKYLLAGGKVFLQSDVEEVAKEMGDRFQENSSFIRDNGNNWLSTNPLPIATEREIATQAKGEPIYRALFIKKHRFDLDIASR